MGSKYSPIHSSLVARVDFVCFVELEHNRQCRRSAPASPDGSEPLGQSVFESRCFHSRSQTVGVTDRYGFVWLVSLQFGGVLFSGFCDGKTFGPSLEEPNDVCHLLVFLMVGWGLRFLCQFMNRTFEHRLFVCRFLVCGKDMRSQCFF